MPADLFLRDAQHDDMPAIQAIYAVQVLHGLASFELEPPTCAEMTRRWREICQHGLPYLVAEHEGDVVGYAYASLYRPRPAYRHTVEDSIYVREDQVGRGVGRALLGALIERAEQGGWRQMVAIIADTGDAASLALHEKLGFERTGVLRCVGFKHGRWLDTLLLQRRLGVGEQAPPERV